MYRKKATAISLPLSRTAKIMTSAVGVESVNQDIVALATKATEIFLMDFARRAYDQSSDEEFRSNVLEYDDIQKLVHSDSRYDFLIDTTPRRIKFSEALSSVEEANKRKEAQMNREKELKKVKLEHDLQKKKDAERTRIKEEKRDGGDEQHSVVDGQDHEEEQSNDEAHCNGDEDEDCNDEEHADEEHADEEHAGEEHVDEEHADEEQVDEGDHGGENIQT